MLARYMFRLTKPPSVGIASLSSLLYVIEVTVGALVQLQAQGGTELYNANHHLIRTTALTTLRE